MSYIVIIFLVTCSGSVLHAQNVTEPRENPCDSNPCQESTYCHPLPSQSDGSWPYLCLAEGYRPGTCSQNAYLTCDEFAMCVESSDFQSFTCQCQQGATGDGFKLEADGSGCLFPFKPCSSDDQCPEYGYCDTQVYKCACKPGFEGNGFTCSDVNECLNSTCDQHAICQNSPGSFTCTCDAANNFVGNGFTCALFCYNDNNCDVPRAKCNANNTCECISGYQGDGLTCTDVDECAGGVSINCSSNAQCINKIGGYQCQCKNGFTGDGYTCTKRPQKCDDIPSFKPGQTYLIDPDFTGPAQAFEVICDLVSGIILTKVPPTDIFPLATPDDDTPLTINYKPRPADIVPLTENAVFCSQDISFSCYSNVAMFPGTVWMDARGRSHENWGSTKNKKCACGEVSICPSSCYCDGSQKATLTTDSGQLIDKYSTPIVSIIFNQPQKDKGRLNIGPLICAQKPINVSRDCHEAKFKYGIKKNTPLYIDVDGPGGYDPVLTFCDMETYSHVGITNFSPDRPLVVPITSDGEQVTYNVELLVIQALIDRSEFCSQSVEYTCKNSRLSGNGGYINVTASNQKLSYFPGAPGVRDSCGCGATQSCHDPQVKCNCDIEDDLERKDFGLIIYKEHLPVAALTAVVGASRSGRYRVGKLQCSQKQFGIEPNCEKYRATGEAKENGTYWIDPDGPDGLQPFVVECEFMQNPPQGVTVVHHKDEAEITITHASWLMQYLLTSTNQIEALKNRSTMCTQEVTISCSQFSIQKPGATIVWSGPGQGSYSLKDYLTTCGDGGGNCNCQSGATNSADNGLISDLEKLPTTRFDFSAIMGQLASGGQLSIRLGSLKCSEVFPTCAVLKKFLSSDKAVEGEAAVVDGVYTIDPDGRGGVDGFQVTCTFPTTVISIESPVGGVNPDPNNPGSVSNCFDIVYKNNNGDIISSAQVTALVQKSNKCVQDLVLECQNAPASNHINYTSCDGQPQLGWAGSFGEDKCACGVNGNCDGGPQASCNCDVADDVVRSDSGSLINKTSMPVCQICLSIDPIIPSGGGSGPTSMLKYRLGELKCDIDQGTKTNCQDARRKAGTSIKTTQEVPVAVSKDTPVPVGCRLLPSPAVGILVVKASKPVNPPSSGNHTDIKIIYITISITQVRLTFKDNEYCSQNIFLFNSTAQNLQLGGNWGFFTHDGHLSDEWMQLNGTSKYVIKACQDHADLCAKFGLPKGFSLTNKEELPVSRVLLSGAGVVVVVGDVECLDLKRSCQEIMDTNSKSTGFIGGKRYAIDTDGAREVEPFQVNCEFDEVNRNGVTEVVTTGQWVGEVVVSGHKPPGSFFLKVEYSGASPTQVNSLALISAFCWQGVLFNCRSTPLVSRADQPYSFYDLYGRLMSPSFGTGSNTNLKGCACSQTGTCAASYGCNCDTLAPLGVDQGALTDKNLLPITGMYVGGQNSTRSLAKIQVTAVRCSSLPIDPPRDCADALKIKSRFGVSYAYNGEYLISPDPRTVQPFMARCEFDYNPGIAVTVIKVVSEKVPLNKPGTPTKIDYHAPSIEQLLALVEKSKFCYQGVKYECLESSLFSQGGYWQSAGSTDQYKFWGGGLPRSDGHGGVCACGQDQNCGGLDSALGQRKRACNCDLVDNTPRADAGIFNLKQYLPLTKFTVGLYAKFRDANLTVGDLYCSQEPLKFNECDLGFYDCHPRASCVDQDEGYRCVCPPGWNGKGVVLNSNQARANGRECIDDNECVASKPCPYSATCVNTPGDFTCLCKPGYKQTGKTSCQDINECLNSTLNQCDTNARCDNLDGSYRCACNRGYRGDGRSCIPIGECVCFGDPHCYTFDNHWRHNQDLCDYVMSQDGCQTGVSQTFRIEIQTWKRDSTRPGQFAYVKSVRVYIFDKEIRLEQQGRILVDGRVVRQYYDGHRFSITVVNNKIRLWTVFELVVTWDGKDVVEVTVPKNAKDSVCGLCGNYNGNKSDDTIQGPACPRTAGQQTDNEELFAQSWIVENTTCQASCEPSEPGVPDTECFYPKVIVDRECNKLLDIRASPFKECLKLKNVDDVEEFRDSCVYDLCHVDGDLDDEICRFAEILSWDCSDNEKVDVSGWKSEVKACEGFKCPNNLIYKPCGSSTQRTCLTPEPGQSTDSNICTEGCFCEKNMVLEGDKCILPEQCGCFYDNGYLATGDTIILPNCSFKIECVGSNVTAASPLGCDQNEECRTEDGVLGCYCQEGFVKKDSDECEPDVCFKVECEIPNMACVDGTCLCKMGFIGDCSLCEDVNECATGIAVCNKIGQTCHNTDGSFRCVCEDGFIGNGDKCKDVDECEYQIDNCGDNSECVNIPGSYLCECCAGFTKSRSGQCVRDPASGPVAAKCCACQGKTCAEPGKVCGTDGKTYSNFRSLSITACRTGNDQLKVNYKGPCKGTCATVICNKHYSTCEVVNGIPTCQCPTCADVTSSFEDVTVCGTNKVTYISKCHMEAATCEVNLETKVEVEYTGRPCPGNGGPPLAGAWSNWSDCSEDCKQGVRVRTRDVYVNSSEIAIHSMETIPCYGTCSQGPCLQDTCTGPGQVCVADENNAPSCECPVCEDFPEEPVCGRLGIVIQTYMSECELNLTVCQTGEPDYEILEHRACEDKPVECGLIRKYDVVVDENGCEADRSINFGECYGGCDDEAELCCFGNNVAQKSAIMYCPDGSNFERFFEVITGCNCVQKSQIEDQTMKTVN